MVLVATAVVLLVVAGAMSVLLGPAPTSSIGQSSAPRSGLSSGIAPATPYAGCNYTISLSGSTPVAVAQSGTKTEANGTDTGALVTSLMKSQETFCFSPGRYLLATQIDVRHLQGVTLELDRATVMQATSGNRLLEVTASPKTVVSGGEWIGSGRSRVSLITLQLGSNDSVVEGMDVSQAGANGILIYDNVRPSYNDSVLNNFVHDNSRFGIQEYSNASAGMTGTTILGNVALDNRVGGIYTNAVSGVTISHNLVRNTLGNGPGEIGIGVTNGNNDTVTQNQVDHMAWFGIQAYYNNYTLISDNVSTANSGSEDQSGITNDHSSFNTITGNVVSSNGKYGVYVEKSWNVTISGNIANGNLGYGIGLYHGSVPVMGGMSITGNTCSFNGLGGMVLNSVVESEISMNQCYNNDGDGILLYNDPGQAGSTGNVISENWLGNQAGSAQTQSFGVSEGNDSDNNTLISNVFVDN
ncbi:MAG TPA: NosD domain-containing protein, partial [Nitrososphaerales archaeon]|nr:NosD domain-containing protein [Nitrososphaerales archaeon]